MQMIEVCVLSELQNYFKAEVARFQSGFLTVSFNPKQTKGGRNQDAACLAASPGQ